MTHKPILIQNLEILVGGKTCFKNFTTQINSGNRIGIIGNNGSGKSTLMKALIGNLEHVNGVIKIPEQLTFSYVSQLIENSNLLSSGQYLSRCLNQAIKKNADILFLDEPTNHLDQHNRKMLMRALSLCSSTLVIVSHDTELLRNHVDILWHINDYKVNIFSGNYDDYINELYVKKSIIEQKLTSLKHQKKTMHEKLMKEQTRAATSKKKGKKSIINLKFTPMAANQKRMQAEATEGKKFKEISDTRANLIDQMNELNIPKIIVPKFYLNADSICNRNIVQISNGSIAWLQNKKILSNLNISIYGKDRVAFLGNNGSGKSSLIKAILSDKNILAEGEWFIPAPDDIGYLDQNYSNLNLKLTVLDSLANIVPRWSYVQLRKHMNDFLFKKNEEVENIVCNISEGEKVRLSLALISAKVPRLLILDEVTNNLDIETREHVTQVIKNYPGTLIIISHDNDFLSRININKTYEIVSDNIIKQI